MSYVDRSETRAYSVGAMTAGIGGYALSKFVGAVAWIPMIAGGAAFVILKKVVDRNVAVIATLAALIAQTCWFLLGAILLPGQAANVALDIAVNVALIVLVFWKPGYVSSALTIAWAILGVVIVSLDLGTGHPGPDAFMTMQDRALIAHIIMRIAIIAAAATIMIFKAHPDLIPSSADEEELLS